MIVPVLIAALWMFNAVCAAIDDVGVAADKDVFWCIPINAIFYEKVERFVPREDEPAESMQEEKYGYGLTIRCSSSFENTTLLTLLSDLGDDLSIRVLKIGTSSMISMTYTMAGRTYNAMVSALIPDSQNPSGKVTITPPGGGIVESVDVTTAQPLMPTNVYTSLCGHADFDVKFFLFQSGEDQGVCVQAKVNFSDISHVDVSVGYSNYFKGTRVVNPQYSKTFDFLRG